MLCSKYFLDHVTPTMVAKANAVCLVRGHARVATHELIYFSSHHGLTLLLKPTWSIADNTGISGDDYRKVSR